MAMIDELKEMTREEAIEEIRIIFEGNKQFISYCEVMIASTDNFVGIQSIDIKKDSWDWEKLLRISIRFGYFGEDGTYRDYGFRNITYRKGNKKYGPGKLNSERHNTTSDIHDYSIFTIRGTEEEYVWKA